ncbi:ThiF family adenylyltransferase [Candidatus Micrarchaeota archaeon]|nr:ThiF family adenylyltransferase [Candidatus Micrarchaeota archaeon]
MKKLKGKLAVIVGAGRTGTHSLKILCVLKGISLRVIDRDFIRESDIGGCALYCKNSVGRLKAGEAKRIAGKKFGVEVQAECEHLRAGNARKLLGGASIVLDCTDNWGTRALINQYCLKNGIPWVYCGALAGGAMCATTVPPGRPCFECWAPALPTEPVSCSEVGVELKAIKMASEMQVEETKRILAGETPELTGKLRYFESRTARTRTLLLKRNPQCPTCAKRQFERLEGGGENAILSCGGGEWLFLNPQGKKVRHYGTKRMLEALEPLLPHAYGSLLKLSVNGLECAVFRNLRVTVRARERNRAAEANAIILSKLGASEKRKL